MSTLPQPSTTALNRWLRFGIPVVLVLLVTATTFQYIHKISSRPERSAILRWKPQILDMHDGVNIAKRYNYPNPPIMALLLSPIVQMPPTSAGLTWFFLKIVMAGLAVYWIIALVQTKEQPFPLWARVLAVALSIRPLMGDLQHGNVNIFILFLVVAFLMLYRLRWDLNAGLVLALAIACKVTPALFLPYLVWKRAWKALIGCGVGLALFLYPGYVPSLVIGQQANHEHVVSWYEGMVRPFLVEGDVWSERENQSLPGVFYRLFTHSPSDSTYVGPVYTPTVYSNLVDVAPSTIRWVLRGCTVLFGLLILWTCRPGNRERHGWLATAEYSLIVLGMLLFSARTWKHHCVTLALPFMVLCYYLATQATTRATKRFVIASLAAAALLMATTSHGLLPEKQAEEAQVYGAYVWAYLVLVVALAVLMLKSYREPTPQAPTPT